MLYFLISQTDCARPELANLIQISKKVFSFLELAAPIALIIMLAIHLTTLMTNPEDKKAMPKLKNSIFACVILFFVPVITNLVLLLTESNFTISSCWKNADSIKKDSNYIATNENARSSILINPDEYEKGTSTNKKKEG